VFVAAEVLDGTTGEVEKVLVQAIVCTQVNLTTALSLALAHKALFKSTWSDNVQPISPQFTQVIYPASLFNSDILSLGCKALSALDPCADVANSEVL
jgi:hypothetical protein